MRIVVAILIVFLGLQGGFWYRTHSILPDMGVVPDVPGKTTLKALSFGDDQALFRLLALNLQNAGDTFGRFTALYKYDFNKLYHWFTLLDTLDNNSNFLPSMATYYFSQSQNKNDVRYIIDYLDQYSKGREQEKWWWTVQGAYLASHKMKDLDKALELASRLDNIRGIPLWAQQMPAFIHEKRGEFDDAAVIIQNILQDEKSFTQSELNFMRYFAKERLNKLDEVKEMLESVDKSRITNAEKVPDMTSHIE